FFRRIGKVHSPYGNSNHFRFRSGMASRHLLKATVFSRADKQARAKLAIGYAQNILHESILTSAALRLAHRKCGSAATSPTSGAAQARNSWRSPRASVGSQPSGNSLSLPATSRSGTSPVLQQYGLIVARSSATIFAVSPASAARTAARPHNRASSRSTSDTRAEHDRPSNPGFSLRAGNPSD